MSKIVARAHLLAVILTSLAGSASAQTTDSSTAPPPLVFRDTVVVTAERGDARQSWIPAATVSMDAASLRALPAVSLGEFLSFVPGFRVQQPALHGGRPVVSARGAGTSYLYSGQPRVLRVGLTIGVR